MTERLSFRLPSIQVALPRLSLPEKGFGGILGNQLAGAGSLLPESPILFAGAVGGPVVIGSLTPLRNACTLAAQDSTSTGRQIYGRVFSRGLLSGWTGAFTPAAAAAVQFTVLGPGFLLYLKLFGSPSAAIFAGAVTESLITYAPSTRNAQLMHNGFAEASEKVTVRPLRPAGPGFGCLVLRNVCANAGIRVLSDPLANGIAQVTGQTGAAKESGVCKLSADFIASVFCGALSMPFNQMFNHQVTSAAYLAAGPQDRVRLALNFLRNQYLVPSPNGGMQLSRMVMRDMGLRSFYIGCMFSSYAVVERLALSLARRS